MPDNTLAVFFAFHFTLKTVAILLTHSLIHYDGALRDTIVNADMKNSCRLCHIGTEYPFSDSKERGQVLGSLPTHNGNSPF